MSTLTHHRHLGKCCRSLLFFALILLAGTSASASTCNLTATWIYSNTSGDSVLFHAVDTASTARIYWNFGDGSNYGSGIAPLHVYSTPGSYHVCMYIYSGSNCSDSLCSTITVGHPCPTSAAWQYYTVHDSAHFYSSNTNSGVVFYWNFGDGTTGTGPTPWHGYAQPGTYHVCLYTYISGSTCRDSFCNTITIAAGCHVTSTWTYTSVGNDSIHFAGADTNSTAHHIWNFGDGTSASGFDNTHVYAQPGTYHVCYYVYIPGTSCTDSTCNTITVTSSCPSHISWTYRTSGDTVFFTPSSINTTVHYDWRAGDSTYFFGPTPFHVYPGAGTYHVCLFTYIPGTQCLDSFCNNVTITTGCNITSAWTYTTSRDSVYFRSAGTNSSAHYYWNFGDGSSGSGQTVNHLYAQPGTYHVCSYVYLPNTNCFDSTCNTVVVTAGCTLNAAWQSYNVNDSVHFYTADTSSLVRRFWNFGDGSNTGTGTSPWHGYAQPGTYHVCLTAYIPGTNCVDSFCNTVIVGSTGCHVSAAWTYTTHGDSIFLHSTDTSSLNHYYWTFSGGSGAYSGTSVTHVFTGPGTYHICLHVYTPNTSCQDSSCNNVIITGGCTLNGAWTSTSSANNDTAHFYATDTLSSIYRHWNYGDGTNYGSGATSTHVYAQPGTYNVCLYSYLGNCVDTFCSTVTVGSGCNLTASWSYTVHGDTVTFTSVDTASAHHHVWNFGVGSNGGSGTTVSYVYPNYGTYHVCLFVYTPGTSCTDSSCNSVTITTPTCQANAAWTSYNVADSTHFYAYDTSTSVYFRWTFGDGTYGTNRDPWHPYAQAGTYHVCLYVYTPGTNCVDSFCNNVTIGTGCHLTSAWSYRAYGDSVHLTGVDTTSAAHHIWVFGDGTYTTGLSANHTYSGPGTYHVCYYVYLPGTTCSDSTCNNVIIDTACTLNVTWTYTTSNVGDTVYFHATNTDTTVHRFWNFGDGSSNYGTGINPYHVYAHAGTYHVCLYAYIPGTACSDSFCNNVTIGSGCRLTGSWSYTTSGDSVHFVGADTTSAAHHIFNFGDGTYSTSGTSVGHRYPGPGSYHVCFYVYLPGTNCADSSCNNIVVDTGCTANATWTSYTLRDSAHFQATDTSSSVQRYWRFGDGTSGSGTNPWHGYAQPGTYHVCLYAYTGSNCVDSFCNTVTVSTGCNITSAWSYTNNGDSVHFTNAGNNTSAHYVWNFGDGTTGSGYDIRHAYPGPGTYHVCSYVYIPNTNCSDSTCNTIVIDTGCITNAAWSAYSSGDTVFFFAADTNPALHLDWRLGDTTYAFGTHPFHVYSHAATYNVCLFAYIPGTPCLDSFCNIVTVGNTNLNSSWTYVVSGDTVQFIQNDTNSSARHFWSYGDGTTSLNDTTHSYSAPGTYNVCYYVYIPNSSSMDSTCNTVTVSGACALNTYFMPSQVTTDSFSFTAMYQDSSTYLVWAFGDGTTTSGSYVAHRYAAPGIYHVCVQAYVPGTPCTDTVCGDVNTTGITEVSSIQHTIRLVPNPFSQSAIINITGPASAYEVHIYDLVGHIVRTEKSVNNSILIERGSLTTGMYIYEVTTEGTVIGNGKMTVE